MIDYIKRHVNDGADPLSVPRPLKYTDLIKNGVSVHDARWVEGIPNPLLLEVIQIANFLHIPGLLELSVAQFASRFRALKRNQDAVRSAFEIEPPSKPVAADNNRYSMEDKKRG